jgi:hypothetical protein
MGRLACTLALGLGTLALAGCGAGSKASGTPESIVVEKLVPAKIDLSEPLPPDVCYVALRGYDVEISGRSEHAGLLCDAIAAEFLPGEPRLRWPPRYLNDPDATPSVVCVLAGRTDRLEIDYGPSSSYRIDADSICDALIARGWKKRPPYEGLDGPWPADTDNG